MTSTRTPPLIHCSLGWVIDGRVVQVGGDGLPSENVPQRGKLRAPDPKETLESQSIDDFVAPAEIRSIEVYPGANGPQARYGHFPCGVVMIWTHAGS